MDDEIDVGHYRWLWAYKGEGVFVEFTPFRDDVEDYEVAVWRLDANDEPVGECIGRTTYKAPPVARRATYIGDSDVLDELIAVAVEGPLPGPDETGEVS